GECAGARVGREDAALPACGVGPRLAAVVARARRARRVRADAGGVGEPVVPGRYRRRGVLPRLVLADSAVSGDAAVVVLVPDPGDGRARRWRAARRGADARRVRRAGPGRGRYLGGEPAVLSV